MGYTSKFMQEMESQGLVSPSKSTQAASENAEKQWTSKFFQQGRYLEKESDFARVETVKDVEKPQVQQKTYYGEDTISQFYDNSPNGALYSQMFEYPEEYRNKMADMQVQRLQQKMQAAEKDLERAETRAQSMVKRSEELSTVAGNIEKLRLEYEETGDEVKMQAYLMATERYNQMVQKYNEDLQRLQKDEKVYNTYNQAYVNYERARLMQEQRMAAQAERDEKIRADKLKQINQLMEEDPAAALVLAEADGRQISRVLEELENEKSALIRTGEAVDWDAVDAINEKIEGVEALQNERLRAEANGKGWNSSGVEFVERAGSAIASGVYQGMAGIQAAIDMAANPVEWLVSSTLVDVAKITGNEELMKTAEKWYQASQELSGGTKDLQGVSQYHLDKATSEAGKVDGWILNNLQSVGGMMFDAWVAGMGGAAGEAAGLTAGKTMAVRAAGGGMIDAANKGYSTTEQLLVGVANGALEYISEKMFGGNPLYDADGGFVTDALAKVIKNPKILRLMYSKGFDIAAEGLEEVFVELLQPVAEGVITGTDIDWASGEDIASAMAGGMFISLLGSGAQVMVTEISGQGKKQRQAVKDAGTMIQNADAVQDLILEGLAAKRGTEAYELAAKMQNKLDSGKTVSVMEIGRLLIANQEAIEAGYLTEDTKVEPDTKAPENALTDPEQGFYAIVTFEENGKKVYALAQVGQDGKIVEKTPATDDLFMAKTAAEIRGLNIRHIGTEQQLYEAAIEEEAEYVNNHTYEEERVDAGSEIAGEEMPERIYEEDQSSMGQVNTAETENTAQTGGIDWAGNDYGKGVETDGRNETAVDRSAQNMDAATQKLGHGRNAARSGERPAGYEDRRNEQKTESVSRRRKEANRIRAYATDHGIPLRSAKDIGIKTGSEVKNLRVLPRGFDENVDETIELAESAGLRAVVVSGPIKVMIDGVERYMNGAIHNGVVYVQADSVSALPQQIAKHELFHEKAAENPELIDKLWDFVRNNYDDTEIRRRYNQYYEAYKDVYTDADPDTLRHMMQEELLADAYAEYERYGDETLPGLTEEAWEQAQRDAGAKSASGGGAKFSMESPVEEVGNLVAYHNLSGDKLLEALRKGGFAAPSTAIVKYGMVHTEYGDITIVFRKETIDPEADSRNKYYGDDAATPIVPGSVAGVKVDTEVTGMFADHVWDLIGTTVTPFGVNERHTIKDVTGSATHFAPSAAAYVTYVVSKAPVRLAYLIEKGKVSKETFTGRDYKKLSSLGALKDARKDADYRKWVEYWLNGAVTKMDPSLQDIVDEMYRNQPERRFSPLISPEYKTLDEARENADRISHYANGASGKFSAGYSEKLGSILHGPSDVRQTATRSRDEKNAIAEELYDRKVRSAADIKNGFEEAGAPITLDTAQKLERFFRTADQRKVNYHEAKPGRVVGVQEIAAIVAPNNIHEDLRAELEKHGIKPIEYKAGSKRDRIAKTNMAAADMRFSISGEEHAQTDSDGWQTESYAAITERQQELYQRERSLEERKREANNNPELLQVMDDYSELFSELRELLSKRRNGTATQEELDRIEEVKVEREEKLKRAAELQKTLGLEEMAAETEEIRKTKEELRVAADAAWEREGAERENRAIEKAGIPAPEYFRKKALKAFKTTTNFNEAGYLLPDGKMLNFSGGERNHRYRDHREIGEIYEATNGVKALNRFLSDGNIRIMAESPGIDLASGVEPTNEQYLAIRKFVNTNGVRDGRFFVDFSGTDGRREGNLAYEGRVSADRIVNDIKHYYETGEIRKQSEIERFLFSVASEDKARERAEKNIANGIGRIMSMPASAVKKLRSGMIRELLEEYQQTGEIDADKLSDAVATAFAEGLVADNEFYETYKPVKEYLRTTAVTISEQNQHDIADYNQFRKKAFGTLRIVREGGLPVDAMYQEVLEMAPELLKPVMTHPADQLMQLYEKAREIRKVEIPLERAMGEQADQFYEWAEGQILKLLEKELTKYADSVQWKQKERSAAQANRRYETETYYNPEAVEQTEETGQFVVDEFVPKPVAEELSEEEKARRGTAREWIQYVMRDGRPPEEFAERMRKSARGELKGGAKILVERMEETARQRNGDGANLYRDPDLTDEEYEALNAAWKAHQEQKADRKKQDLVVQKKDFKSTPAMDKLGIKIDGSVTRYRATDMLRGYEKAARDAADMLNKRIKKMHATGNEIKFARMIADGTLTGDEINWKVIDIGRVTELADYFMARKSFEHDMLYQRRAEIDQANNQIAKDLLADKENYRPHLAGRLKNYTKLVMNERSPERVIKQIFGVEQGQKIFDFYFRPVWVNGSEAIRFKNRMLRRAQGFTDSNDKTGGFMDQNGKRRQLTDDEWSMAQRLLEGKSVAAEFEKLKEDKQSVVANAARKLVDGVSQSEVTEKYDLGDGYMLGITQAYAGYLLTNELADDMDRVIMENAIKAYQQMYNEFYDAYNDFLVSHGFEEIGFIRNYAPHFQKSEVQHGLRAAMRALGVTNDKVEELPAEIAGITADFKPNKKWNPHAETRKGKETDYHLLLGFQRYLNYASEVFFHTDDVMRLRSAVKLLRAQYAAEDISAQIQDALSNLHKGTEWKQKLLVDMQILEPGHNYEPRAVNKAFDDYTEELLKKANPENLVKWSEFTTWMDNAANIIAGKQSLADRGTEFSGRLLLNMGNKLASTFAKANVAGNLSSVLNQTAQVPLLQVELGKYLELAARDMINGKVDAAFVDRSDFLTEKKGEDILLPEFMEKAVMTMFKPAQIMDSVVSKLAVRGMFLKALDEGMTNEEAMRAADDFGRRVMGTRMRGVRPQGFESKNSWAKMIHMFQLENANVFDYMLLSDMPQAVQHVAKTKGKKAATKYAAVTAAYYVASAAALNAIVGSISGGSPAPFDIIGWLLTFVAAGWGRGDEEFLKTVIDNGWEKMFEERPFRTKPFDRDDGFDWAGATGNAWYEMSNDIPYVSNIAGVMGWGDQTTPTRGIREAAEDLRSGVATMFNQITGGEKKTGLDWAGAIGKTASDVGNALSGVTPGGRQAKKTVQAIRALVLGGRYSGFGNNKKLMYTVDRGITSAAQGLLFGPSAWEETDDYYAGGKMLTAAQTQKAEALRDRGVNLEDTYELYQDFSEINEDLSEERTTSIEAKQEKRDLINEMDLSDDLKMEVYLETVVTGGTDTKEAARERYEDLMGEGVSWSQITNLENDFSSFNEDADGDGNADMSSLERGMAERNTIADMDLTDWQKLEVFDRYMLSRNENYETVRAEFEAMLNEDLTWDDITNAHNTYAMLNADDALNATQKATAYAKWADEKGWTAVQIEAVKERYTFWQMIPAEAASYEKFSGAGLSSDNAAKVVEILSGLEPEDGKKNVSDVQRIEAIANGGFDAADTKAAVRSVLSESQAETFDDLMKAGMTPKQYAQYRRAVYGLEADKDANGKPISGSKKKKVLNAIDRLPISDGLKTELYFASGYGESTLKDAPWK